MCSSQESQESYRTGLIFAPFGDSAAQPPTAAPI